MKILSAILLLALTRAEIVARMKAPVINQADGFIQVIAMCDEARRQEYQLPMASFAADTVKTLYRAQKLREIHFDKPALILNIGDVVTNENSAVTTVETNADRVVTRIRVANPATVEIEALRLEIVRAFSRSILTNEISVLEARELYRVSDPKERIADDRAQLERWLKGERGDDEECLKLMRKVIEPGVSSKRDILTFASRLFLYPRLFDEKFLGRYEALSFRDAIKVAKVDPRVRFIAFFKADEMLIFGAGRSNELRDASELYAAFLKELARPDAEDDTLKDLLELADAQLATALEKAQ